MPLCLSHALFASFCSTQCGKPSLWLNPDSSVFFCIWAICSLLLFERCPLAVREKKTDLFFTAWKYKAKHTNCTKHKEPKASDWLLLSWKGCCWTPANRLQIHLLLWMATLPKNNLFVSNLSSVFGGVQERSLSLSAKLEVIKSFRICFRSCVMPLLVATISQKINFTCARKGWKPSPSGANHYVVSSGYIRKNKLIA